MLDNSCDCPPVRYDMFEYTQAVAYTGTSRPSQQMQVHDVVHHAARATMRRDLSQVRCYRDGVRCNASILTPLGARRVTYIMWCTYTSDVLSSSPSGMSSVNVRGEIPLHPIGCRP